MLLIAAALMEELETALNLFSIRTKLKCPGIQLWTADRQNVPYSFLKTGIGPERSSKALTMALRSLQPSSILVIGYAGALDDQFRSGDLAILRRVARLGVDEDHRVALESTNLAGGWGLARSSELFEIAGRANTPAHICEGVTSPYIIGESSQKRLLRGRFGVSVVDMETAELARVAASNSVPLACVRSVSDEVGDAFLAPFTYDPAATRIRRAARVVTAGNWIGNYGEWRKRAAVARASLHKFMAALLAH